MVKQFSIPGRFRLQCTELANNLALIKLIEKHLETIVGVNKIKFNQRSKRFLVEFNLARTSEERLIGEICKVSLKHGVGLKLKSAAGTNSRIVEDVLYGTAFDVLKKMTLPKLLAPLGGKYKLLFGVAMGLLKNSMKHKNR